MRKRLLALGLCICLCGGTISAVGVTVRAEEGSSVWTGGDSDSTSVKEVQIGEMDGKSGAEGEESDKENGTAIEEPSGDNTEGRSDGDELSEQSDQDGSSAGQVEPVQIQCIDEDGNIYYITDDVSPVVEDSGIATFSNNNDMVVNFRVKQNGTVVGAGEATNYTEYGTGDAGYTHGLYGADAAYLGTVEKSGKTYVKFMLSGVVGLVDESLVQVVKKSNVGSVSSYYINGTNLIHRICTNMNTTPTSSLNVGVKPSYLQSGIVYYSYDGHYFYTDYSVMLSDYQNDTRKNSVNPNSPYYNYYQYLPLRSKTAYTAEQLNSKIDAKTVSYSNSKLKNLGSSLISNQNTYGVNALLTLGLAVNESWWGTSSIAQSKNNLFGLNAVDSSPGTSADTFASVNDCVKNFMEGWMSKQYLNPNNWSYYGGFLGNKASGINVKYASDPYWGEKAAHYAWILSDSTDQYQYTIGIKDTLSTEHTDLNVRKETSASSTKLFSTGTQSNHAFIILGESNGFYKVQSDPVLNSGRTAIDSSTGKYNFSSMYAYVSCDYVDKVSAIGNNNNSSTEFSVLYSSHVQTYGWLDSVKNGEISGTEGQSKRMEAIKIWLKNAPYSGSVQYRTYVQNYRWLDWKSDGAEAGTSGQSKRMEAIQIKLTGELANHYDIYYRVHAQNFGWLGWAKNGDSAGTADYSKRLEAIQIVLVEKGGAAPGSTVNAFLQNGVEIPATVKYQTHIQTYGWQNYVADGTMSGTEGQSKRLEAIRIALGNKSVSGSIRYKTHVQTYGWLDWVGEDQVSGTEGQSKRLEAIQIELTGEMANKYDIYYRVHSQNYGWLGWAKNGQKAGTAGYSKRLEAIQIRLVPKGGTAPGSTANCYIEK